MVLLCEGVELRSATCSRLTEEGTSLGKCVRSVFASRRARLQSVELSPRDCGYTAQLPLYCTAMLRKFGKTVREKLDHIESRMTFQENASADQPGSHFSSRHGGSEPPTPGDFPTQGDLFKFRKQRGVNLGASPTLPIRFDRLVSNCFQARGLCWRGGLQIVRFGKLIRRGKVISTSLVGHAPERFCMTIGEIGSLKVIGPG